jgi:hypothetical protein
MARLRMSGAISPLSYIPSCTGISVLVPSTWSGYTARVGIDKDFAWNCYGTVVEYLLNCCANRKLVGRLTLGWLQHDALWVSKVDGAVSVRGPYLAPVKRFYTFGFKFPERYNSGDHGLLNLF